MDKVSVILLQRVHKLGHLGDVVEVAPGYARNFLLPKKMALRATRKNLEIFDNERAQIEQRNSEARDAASALAVKMQGLQITVIRSASEKGQLYGSVSAKDIAAAIQRKGFAVHHSNVHIVSPFKTIGVFNVEIALHPEIHMDIILSIGKSEEEAQMQLSSNAQESV